MSLYNFHFCKPRQIYIIMCLVTRYIYNIFFNFKSNLRCFIVYGEICLQYLEHWYISNTVYGVNLNLHNL